MTTSMVCCALNMLLHAKLEDSGQIWNFQTDLNFPWRCSSFDCFNHVLVQIMHTQVSGDYNVKCYT